ncbi:hypothetical protein HDZ31DRAFT_45534 [Schizophyllum fasciatum]
MLTSSCYAKCDLAQALDDDLPECFKGDFSFCRTYLDAPNPGLYLPNDVGVIGLPLNPREAPAVVCGCQRLPPLTIQRETGLDWLLHPWEMHGSQVRLMYPAWATFTQRVLSDVCVALGINTAVTKPRCKLRKLLLCEPGSQAIHSAEAIDELFATITILLPSPFTGGAIKLTHGSLSTAHDLAASSWYTTVVAWYADVQPSLMPVTSGYAFALTYNVFHAADAPRPHLPSNQPAIENLQRVLLSWKQANSPTVPRKIVYLLRETYTEGALHAEALKGLDARQVSILRTLASQLGFSLGLATANVYVAGEANDEGPPLRKRSPDPYRPPIDFVDDEDLDVDIAIKNLVDLNGELIQDEVEFADGELEDCVIPTPLREAVQRGEPVDEQYEGFHGGRAGNLQRTYKHTVLIIWPQGTDLESTFEDDVNNALNALIDSTSTSPSQHEHRLVAYLFNTALARPDWRRIVARAILPVTCRWSDAAMWSRAVDVCDPREAATLLNSPGLLAAMRVFGFEPVRPALERMLRALESNVARFQLLGHIDDACKGVDLDRDATIVLWLADQREWALEHLTAPSKEDIPILVKMINGPNGATLLRDTLVARLKSVADAETMRRLALYFPPEAIDVHSPEERTTLSVAVFNLLSFAVSKADFFASVDTEGAGDARASTQANPSPAIAIAFIDACLHTGNEILVASIVDRLTEMTGLSSADKQFRTTKVLLPLLPLVAEQVHNRSEGSPAIAGVDELYERSIKLFLDGLSSKNVPSKEDMQALVQASVVHGGSDLMVYKIWPALSALPYRESCVLDFFQAIRDNEAKIPVPDGGPAPNLLVARVLQFIIDQASFTSYDNQMKAISLLKLCLQHDQYALCDSVFARLLNESFINADYVQNVLVPFIPQLRQFLISNRKPPWTKPFDAAFATIVTLWAKQSLGPKPVDPPAHILVGLRKHTCHCQVCADVFKFLDKSEAKSHRCERLGAPKRKHLENELGKFARGAAEWSVIDSSPQGLKITKLDAVYEPLRWRAARARGEAILRSVSQNRVELQRIFGARYQEIMDMLNGKEGGEGPGSSQPFGSQPTASQPTPATPRAIQRTPLGSASQPAVPSSASTFAPPFASQGPRKRKAAHITGDVIDLTTMSP